jgi:hypothetical protein
LFPEITSKRLSNVIGSKGRHEMECDRYLPIRKMDDGRNAKKKTRGYFGLFFI